MVGQLHPSQTVIRNLAKHPQAPSDKLKILKPQLLPDATPRLIDISGGFSGILVEDPDSDIRFMFQSKEGIRLPDLDGRISKELERTKIDVNAVNRLIWDQALIWPIGHFSYGLWVKSKYDLSRLNLVLPPTQLSLIGYK